MFSEVRHPYHVSWHQLAWMVMRANSSHCHRMAESHMWAPGLSKRITLLTFPANAHVFPTVYAAAAVRLRQNKKRSNRDTYSRCRCLRKVWCA